MAQKRCYVTTAIDYPNAPPHMGHVLEKVLADVIVRWMRLRGDEVRFQVGTDEHGVKIQQTAAKEKLTPQQLVDRNVPLFENLYQRLDISYDNFIRTTDTKKHWPTVIELWKKLQAAGALEKRSYSGLYCSGCERFLTKKDLADGKCPIHLTAPQEVTEENWFFLLKREGEWLKKLLKKDYTIVPDFRAPETLTLLDQGLEDVSFSRPVKSLSWGIPVPGEEKDQVMYVWCDALTNYISGLGYFTKKEMKEYWDDAEVTHVIGKDIARFHALIWPAMLKHGGARPPDRLLIHGFLTSEGQKMSKSLGNVVAPDEAIAKYGVDALRFYLSHQIPVGNDGDFSWSRFKDVYQGILGSQIGNLLNRVLVLSKKKGTGIAADFPSDGGLHNVVDWKEYGKALDEFRVQNALEIALQVVDKSNKLMQIAAPWTKEHAEAEVSLTECAEALRHVALMLLPFMPAVAQKMSTQLGVPYAGQMLEKDFTLTKAMKTWGGIPEWKAVGEPSILFPKVE